MLDCWIAPSAEAAILTTAVFSWSNVTYFPHSSTSCPGSHQPAVHIFHPELHLLHLAATRHTHHGVLRHLWGGRRITSRAHPTTPCRPKLCHHIWYALANCIYIGCKNHTHCNQLHWIIYILLLRPETTHRVHHQDCCHPELTEKHASCGQNQDSWVFWWFRLICAKFSQFMGKHSLKLMGWKCWTKCFAATARGTSWAVNSAPNEIIFFLILMPPQMPLKICVFVTLH